jgi:uncharacterized protein
MASSFFIDTWGLYALVVNSDPDHDEAYSIAEDCFQSARRIYTSDAVVSETATLMKARRRSHFTPELFQMLKVTQSISMEWITPERFTQTTEFFLRHADKDYSFTDCSSFVLMRELGLRHVLTKDHHFRQAGFVPLLKSK